jgi:vitellogenic carboxypeptidase-like protein
MLFIDNPVGGMAIGDGWIDPVHMVGGYPDMIYNMGLCDENEKATIQGYCDRTVGLIKEGKMLEAFNARPPRVELLAPRAQPAEQETDTLHRRKVWDQFLNGDVWPYGNYFHNISGLNDYDNFMNTNPPADFDYYAPYLNQPAVRAALHVGNASFPSDPSTCEKHLLADFMVSLVDELVAMLDSSAPDYKVLVYSGQLDVIIGAALTERFLPGVAWKGQDAYNKASKAVWRIRPSDAEVAGYARQVGNFSQVIVRAAGHIVPGDQPERALDMIKRFVEGRKYEHLPDPVKPPASRMAAREL